MYVSALVAAGIFTCVHLQQKAVESPCGRCVHVDGSDGQSGSPVRGGGRCVYFLVDYACVDVLEMVGPDVLVYVASR